MIAKNVVITTDNEGNNYYIPFDKLTDFADWCDSDPDGSDYPHGVQFDGKLFIVDIISEA